MDLMPRFSLIFSSSVFLCFLVFGLSTASYISDDVFGSPVAAGRSLLQTKKSCSVNFEFLDYSVLTNVCKGPRYPATHCCPAFKKFACPYSAYINDLSTDCASTMFSYINLYGKYPPGLFASECREGKEGLDCTNFTSTDTTASSNDGHLTRSPFILLLGLILGFMGLLLIQDGSFRMQTFRRHGFSDDYIKVYEGSCKWDSVQDMDNLARSEDGCHKETSSDLNNVEQSDLPSFHSVVSYTSKNRHGNETGEPYLKQEVEDFSDKLRELESVMFGPDLGTFDLPEYADFGEPERSLLQTEKFQIYMQMTSKGDLREVLIGSAKAMSDNDLTTAEWLMSQLNHMVSASGEPMERLGAYMLEGLIAKLSSSGSLICRSLRCKEPVAGSDLLSYMHLLYEVCPYFKFGYMSANGAIAEAMRDENKIHIIDFQIS